MLQCLCIGWILGLAMMGKSYLYIECSAMQVLSLICMWFLFFRFFHTPLHTAKFKFLVALGSFIFAFILGHAYANHALNQRLMHIEHEVSQRDIIAYVKNLDRWSENSLQQPIDVLNIDGSHVQWMASIKAEPTHLQDMPELKLGQYYRLQGEVRPAQAYATPGAFDVEKWYIEQNIMAGFRVKHAESLSPQQVYQLGYSRHVRAQNSITAHFRLWIESKRSELRGFLIRQPIRQKGLLLALLTGDKSLLSKTTQQQFQRFGMSHLLAISGPHVVIFAFMVCLSLQWFFAKQWPSIFLRWPRQYLLCIPFLACVFLYCAFVGFEIPAMRTFLMTFIISLALLLKQQLQPIKLLLYSAAILLLFDPFSILSAAFWLSYGACFVLLRIYQTLQQQPQQDFLNMRDKLYLGLKVLVESQWKIFLALFPLMIIFFKQVAWITPLSNLIAIPWIGLIIVPLDILAALLFFISEPLSSLVFQLNDLFMQLLMGLLNFIDRLFAPKLIPMAMSSWMVMLSILGLIIVFLPKGILPKSWAAIALFPLIVPNHQQDIQLSILDVGQGQSIFIQDAASNMLVDTGGYYDEEKFSVGQQIILPFLSVNGVAKLDHLLLTHLDQDHSGGYESIKHQLKVNHVYANEFISTAARSRFQLCYQGQRLNLSEQVQIQVLSPAQYEHKPRNFNKNEMSCVLHIYIPNQGQYQYFLLMGDAGWQTEFELLQHYPDLKVDVLVLGHHGSHNSSAYDFLQYYKPKLAIASAGKFNRYRHPSPLTQQRLKDLNIPLLSTAEAGSIHFKMQGSVLQLNMQRNEQRWLNRKTMTLN